MTHVVRTPLPCQFSVLSLWWGVLLSSVKAGFLAARIGGVTSKSVPAFVCNQKRESLHSPALYLFWYSTAWHHATSPRFSAISLWGACRHCLDQGLPSSIHCQVQWEETSSAAGLLVPAHISMTPTCPWCGQAVSCGVPWTNTCGW